MERKLEERKKEASKSGEDVIIDPPSPPSRHQRWKLSRRTRSGGVSSDAAREIIAKIACPTAYDTDCYNILRMKRDTFSMFCFLLENFGGLTCSKYAGVPEKDELEAQCTQGNFTPEGRHDILAAAIGRPDHPGRGIGFGVGFRDYFRRSSRRSASINESVLEELTKKITYDVTQNLMKIFGQTLESLGAHS
ncbi:hypothetical protein OROMI_010887 [Orobanche minor]